MSKPVAARSRLTMKANSKILLFALMVFSLGAASFLASTSRAIRKDENSVKPNLERLATTNSKTTKSHVSSILRSPLLVPPAIGDPDLVETFAADCTTPKTAFVLGDTVCAKISGGPSLAFYPRRVSWVDNFNFIHQIVNITTEPQTDTFVLPSAGSTDYRGVWRVNSITSRASVRASAFFTVSDPAAPAADLFMYNSNDANGTSTAGSNIEHVLWFGNKGPDDASNVQVTDGTPANTTFLSGNTDDANLNCTFPAPNSSGGTTTCTMTSLAAGAHSKVTLVFNINSGTTAGTTIANTAHISSDTADPSDDSNTPPPEDPNADPSNNTATSRVGVVAGAPTATCTLQCPDSVTAFANTTENSQRGAHVTFDDAIQSGDCGSVTATPASGSFFPVGTTVVNVTSETGDGSCSFTVTINDTGTNPPTISCPANQTANANNDCEATVTTCTPTATGDNVTIVGVRSDGKPLYNCDCYPVDPNNPVVECEITGACTRRADAPFATGVTTI